MKNESIGASVGAGIVSIITESLYDKPIVVFREYVQNSVDAIDKAHSENHNCEYSCRIWQNDNDLFFLDNATGINQKKFSAVMTSIANSDKNKTKNLGYKGIGRLSGMSYCKQLSFFNIVDYSEGVFQEFTVDCTKYGEILAKNSSMSFDELMQCIGRFTDTPESEEILNIVKPEGEMFGESNTGFLVVMRDVSMVLRNLINSDSFIDDLQWLLPVPFHPELLELTNLDTNKLFRELSEEKTTDKDWIVPAKSFKVFFNDTQLFRPLTNAMMRKYVCRSYIGDFATCIHSFSNKKIAVDAKNAFSGIRIYMDNMLLCDENELIPVLQQFGLLQQGRTYEVIQTVMGIGAIIFITNKIDISANARRTFFEVNTTESYDFLRLIAEFVSSIYTARYALSKYEAAKKKQESDKEGFAKLQNEALESLKKLARSEISLEVSEEQEIINFENMTHTEQKRIIKSKITKELSASVNKYLIQTDEYNPGTCFDDFKTWFKAN